MTDGSHRPSATPGPLANGATMPRPGDVIAERYRVEHVIGSGGMGVVLAATHVELGHAVALKLLLPEIAGANGASERFLREARAAARLTSEHVVRITDTGRLANGAPFMVMERLAGRDLAQELAERGRISVAEAVRYVLEACDALGEAHAQGIVHRDLKPANLFLARRRDGSVRLKVLDFGISKVDGGTVLTEKHAVLGSPRYMSPEQLQDAHSVDLRADVWAIGVILYELVTGSAPFEGETLGALCTSILTKPMIPFERVAPEVPPGFARIVEACLSKHPDGRYSGLGPLVHALGPFAGSLRPPASTAHGQAAFEPTVGDSNAPPAHAVREFASARPGAAFDLTTNASAVAVSGASRAGASRTWRRVGIGLTLGALFGGACAFGVVRWRSEHARTARMAQMHSESIPATTLPPAGASLAPSAVPSEAAQLSPLTPMPSTSASSSPPEASGKKVASTPARNPARAAGPVAPKPEAPPVDLKSAHPAKPPAKTLGDVSELDVRK